MLEPVVDAYEDDNMHEILNHIDDLYTKVLDEPEIFDANALASNNFDAQMENAQFGNTTRSASVYGQLKYASGGTPAYPKGRYA